MNQSTFGMFPTNNFAMFNGYPQIQTKQKKDYDFGSLTSAVGHLSGLLDPGSASEFLESAANIAAAIAKFFI